MFLVVELQKNGDQLAHLDTVCATSEEAESKFHQILAAAAISTLDVHSAVIIGDDGLVYRTESYKHEEAEE